ncbi:MAG: class II aldolase/adducin family protein [Chloroflexi bacterium]|nr:class II aldolase/adducin family protein [Chloroflexota bacterium]
MMSRGDENPRRLLALACHIVATSDAADPTLGFVSLRAAGDACYMKPAGLALEEITPDDVILVERGGRVLEGGLPAHREFPLHTEIYAARPEVEACVHVHSTYGTLLSATREPLLYLNQDSFAFARDGLAFYASPELVVTPELGQAVMATMGMCKALLMRNHGITVAGESVQEACALTLFLEQAARAQILLGTTRARATVDRELARTMAQTYKSPAAYQRMWDYYLRRLRAARVEF